MSHSSGELGRPTLLNDELQEEILRNIRTGAYIETAAVAAGINKSTFYDWLKRGARAAREENPDPGEQKYIEFSNAVKRAQAETELRDISLIGRAAAVSWQAAAWRLERKNPERWGRKDYQHVEHYGEQVNVNLTPEDEEAFEQAVAQFFGVTEALETDDDLDES